MVSGDVEILTNSATQESNWNKAQALRNDRELLQLLYMLLPMVDYY